MTSSQADSKSHKTNQDRYQDVVNYVYVEPEHRRPMWLGALLGLILGLIVGWVIWPVEWTNAYPSDLAEEPKAEFLSSIADAYVAVSDESALALANRRLALFGDDPAADLRAAVTYFEESGQPNNLIRINNLNTLATDLGLYDAQAAPPPEADAPPPAEAEQAPTAAPAAETGEDGAPGWLQWILMLLTAIVLIVGGIAVIRALSRRRHHDDQIQTAQQGVNSGTAGAEAGGSAVATAAVIDDWDDTAADADEVPYEEYHFNDDPEEVSYRPPQSVSSQIDLNAEELPSDYGVPSSTSNDAVQQAAAASALSPLATSGSATGHEVMETFTAIYQIGMPDYDEAFPITDPEGDRYVGECGMGVNSKASILHDNEDEVIALDVWLFDKADERHIGSHIRVLLSEYAFDHGVGDEIADEKEGDPRPIVAQQGIPFTLQGSNLQLDCKIVNVGYVSGGDTKGTFQNIEVKMDVSKRD